MSRTPPAAKPEPMEVSITDGPNSPPGDVDLRSLRTEFDRLTARIGAQHSMLQMQWQALEEARGQLQRERENFEREKAQFMQQMAAAQQGQGQGAAPGVSQPSSQQLVSTLPPSQPALGAGNGAVEAVPEVEFKLCPDILVLEGRGNHTENIIDILNRNRSRLDVREPDTPHHGIHGGFSFPTAQPMDVEDGLNHIATQGTIALFEKMKQQNGADGPAEIAEKTLQYVNSTFDGQRFEHTKNNRMVLSNVMRHLCREVAAICGKEGVMLKLKAPVYVFGDIHGNFADLQYFVNKLMLFDNFSYTSHSFLFLGDYVDRGSWSIECVAYLFALKVKAPTRVWLLRGNHEDWQVNGDEGHYGEGSFKHQCRELFGKDLGDEMWNVINTCFKELPLAAIVHEKVFCCHGGLPRFNGGQDSRISILSDPSFPHFNTFTSVPTEEARRSQMRQMAFDLVWSDPSESEEGLDDFGFGNNPRGGDIKTFGHRAVQQFLQQNNLQFILRAHQEKSDGLKISKHSKVVTIFSSSGYCGHGNGAGVVYISSEGELRMVIKAHNGEPP